ncbi:MAG: hypothetical protein FWD85_09950 [Microbacteriaceae bacterium]|nr:hypothetical protein [Microbacteriaceae bacterium]MCL2795616.1 hypothetical protein [Microbacteriaceae bacterium]
MPDRAHAAAEDYARRHFGRPDAAPKVIAFYTMHGWQPIWDPSLRLNPETCGLVRERGGVKVRVRHRFRTIEVPINRYLGEHKM